MPYRYEYSTTLSIGRNERDVLVTYTVTPGCPETGPSYACGGTPAFPPEVEIERVEIMRERPQLYGRPTVKTWEPAPEWMVEIIQNDADMHSDMLCEAGEDA